MRIRSWLSEVYSRRLLRLVTAYTWYIAKHVPYASNTWKTILEEDAGKPGEERMERRGGHDAVARAPGKGCVRNPSYGHQGDTHRAGGKGSGCSIFGHSPIHLREYQTAEGLTSGKQERGRTRKSWRATGNSAGHGVLLKMMEGRVRNFLFPARPEDAPGTTAAAGKPGVVFLSVSPRRILRSPRSPGISGNIRHSVHFLSGGPYTCPKNRLCPEAGKKEDRRGRRRSSEEEVQDVSGLL